jgi:hypothetical protein
MDESSQNAPLVIWHSGPARIIGVPFSAIGIFLFLISLKAVWRKIAHEDPDPNFSLFLCLLGTICICGAIWGFFRGTRIELDRQQRTYRLYRGLVFLSRKRDGPWNDFSYILVARTFQSGSKTGGWRVTAELIMKEQPTFEFLRKSWSDANAVRARDRAAALAVMLGVRVVDISEGPAKFSDLPKG